ncbi:NUDIX hydrolase [Asanoa iriomotensis]|uniref:NUDIX hydrolase n=1 Tax=Asanoa iriomotensis TaxID=234613 RepID=A0ABQ4BXJ6_9ACTN|nr:NUDIX domain-containing protein [Asanoa iriomotensis]GIF55257.1 NUDIX hydrolase [Asanoa iriomotensis]
MIDDGWVPDRMCVTVDLVIFTILDGALSALIVERGIPPYAGTWALPGGFVGRHEPLEDAARRELREETGLGAEELHLEQLGAFGDPERDPRDRVVTVAYLALAPDLPLPTAGTDARAARWMAIDSIVSGQLALAFDHRKILRHGLDRARSKLEYTSLASAFCGKEFTITELRNVYEVVWNTKLDPRNFHRKITRAPGFLEPTGRRTTRDGGRPAELYRRGDASLLHPPMLMPTGS